MNVFGLVAYIVLIVFANSAASAQIDTFQDGTTQGWTAGIGPGGGPPPMPPTNIATGGPGGLADRYLQITSSGGAGAGSRLVALNASQWAGNYIASGITSIAMDLRNLGATDLNVRLYLENPMLAASTDAAVSASFLLPTGGGWMHAQFAIDAASLTVLMGSATALLSDVTVLRIIDNPSAGFPGPAKAAVLGVDNIAAGAAPAAIAEPGSLLLALLGGAALLNRRRRAANAM